MSELDGRPSASGEMSDPPESLIFAVGYERRSRYVAEQLHDRYEVELIAVGFNSRQAHSFKNNREWVVDVNATYVDYDEADFLTWCRSVLPNWIDARTRIAIDVSSFSRDRIALILTQLWPSFMSGRLVELTLMYAPGEFDRDAVPLRHGLVASAELLPGLAGGWSDPERPITCAIGLGYEPGRALGAVELLEPATTILFQPTGIDVRFDQEVQRVNAALLEPEAGTVRLTYDVMDASALLEELLRLTRGAAVHGRSVLVPLGPKIFAATACVASLLSRPATPVWRLSGGQAVRSRDMRAAGPISCLALRSPNAPDRQQTESGSDGRDSTPTPVDLGVC